ncbi:hypothetical protein BaRGS_00033397 [Batillaria attramentaria]|uniref:Uncharacterized protein n=1 Tax=Batillaria attramentaria TaxID=370345 RepID=A0ABD0JKH8_9CAEN
MKHISHGARRPLVVTWEVSASNGRAPDNSSLKCMRHTIFVSIQRRVIRIMGWSGRTRLPLKCEFRKSSRPALRRDIKVRRSSHFKRLITSPPRASDTVKSLAHKIQKQATLESTSGKQLRYKSSTDDSPPMGSENEDVCLLSGDACAESIFSEEGD